MFSADQSVRSSAHGAGTEHAAGGKVYLQRVFILNKQALKAEAAAPKC